jgi:hypothetical protein
MIDKIKMGEVEIEVEYNEKKLVFPINLYLKDVKIDEKNGFCQKIVLEYEVKNPYKFLSEKDFKKIENELVGNALQEYIENLTKELKNE